MTRNGTELLESVRASVSPATPLPTIRTGADDMLECAVYAAAQRGGAADDRRPRNLEVAARECA